MKFIDQFRGKEFWGIFGGLIAIDLLSFFTFHGPVEPILLGIATLGFMYLAWKRPVWLLPLAIAEIAATSNGHSFNIEIAGVSVGLRMVLFGVLMVATLIEIWKCRQNPVPPPYRSIAGLFVFILIFGGAIGFFGNNALTSIYLDANGYLAMGYVLAAFVWMRNGDDRRKLLQGTAAGIMWIAVKTLFLLFIFAHLDAKTLDHFYRWIRDSRLGEITLQRANIYRIFLQSQWLLIPGLLGGISYMLFGEKQREWSLRWALVAIVSALIISLSRSFGVAIFGALVVGFGVVVALKPWKPFLKLIPDGIGVGIVSMLTLWMLIIVPIFTGWGNLMSFGGVLSDRAATGTDVAIDSRRLLQGPMIEAIREQPIVGHGLGKHLTYQTRDQRYIDGNGTDIVSTYAFEWGWLDIWVKFGILGVFAFGLLFVRLLVDLWKLQANDPAKRWLYIALGLTVVALYATHMFTPYINHPIGWAAITLVFALMPFENEAEGSGVKEVRSENWEVRGTATVAARTDA